MTIVFMVFPVVVFCVVTTVSSDAETLTLQDMLFDSGLLAEESSPQAVKTTMEMEKSKKPIVLNIFFPF
jgi:hypothetical protein